MLDFMLVVVALLLIATILLPRLTRRGVRASRASCTNNLKQLGVSFRIWGSDQNDKFPMQVSVTNGGAMELANQGSAYEVFLVMSNEINTPKILICPNETNSKRVSATTFDARDASSPSREQWVSLFSPTNNTSYFVGLDAECDQTNRIISGDDHFQIAGTQPKPGLFLLQTNAPVGWQYERHRSQGNLAFADGSVTASGPRRLRTALIQTGIATNRLAMP